MPPTPQKSTIFRKVSLERLSSPEQLDSMMRATDPQGWLALITIAVLLVIAMAWSVFAYVPSKVEGNGIILRGGGMQEVFAPVAGVLADLYVKPGDIVKPGDKVAFVYDLESYRRMREYQGILERLQGQLPATPEAQRPAVQADIAKVQAQVDETRAAGMARGVITCPFRGRVVEVLAEKWDMIGAGTHVFYVEALEKPVEALLYVSANDAGRIVPGMKVQIFPDSARREEYGCMEGHVSQINMYPSSAADLQRKFGNEQLAAAMVAGRASVQATVTLDLDPSTPSGFKWSSHSGPNFEIRSGTLCTASVITGERHPISLVIP